MSKIKPDEEKPPVITIRQLVNWRKERVLSPNWEYQRGAVWSQDQARMFIDSVWRGYRIPLLYLRVLKSEDPEYGRDSYEIIDGQQRINALFGFCYDSFIRMTNSGEISEPFKRLFDPSDHVDKERFLPGIQEIECAWAGKKFSDMSDSEQQEFYSRELDVAVLECSDDEARHLFVRLQRGRPLSAQEKRDAWPGDFCGKILDLGGKPELHKQGHPFIREIMKLDPAGKNGLSRKAAAQMLMLFMERSIRGGFVDLAAKKLDKFYKKNVVMDFEAQEIAQRFKKILDNLHLALNGKKMPPLKIYSAIHLIFLADMLENEYPHKWKSRIADAMGNFHQKTRECRKHTLTGEEDDDFAAIWHFHQLTSGSGMNRGDTIRQRHDIYVKQMLRLMNMDPKDRRRSYTPNEREEIYTRDNGQCWHCKEKVAWDDAEIHHLKPHSEGGPTALGNGVLVHRKCHKEIHR